MYLGFTVLSYSLVYPIILSRLGGNHDERNIFKTYSERYKIHSVLFYRGFVKSITAARPYTMRGAIWDKTHQVPALCATQVKSWAGTTPEE